MSGCPHRFWRPIQMSTNISWDDGAHDWRDLSLTLLASNEVNVSSTSDVARVS